MKKIILSLWEYVQKLSLVHHLILVLVSIITLAPMVWMVFLSFKTRKGFASNPFGLPESLNFDNYLEILSSSRMLVFTINSIIVTFTSVFLIVVVSMLAGYALARFEFPGNKFLFLGFILVDAIPVFVFLVPLFIELQWLGIGNTRWALILPYTAMHIGIATFIFRGFFRSISMDIEDAARIDGCNILQMIWYVMAPIIRPAVLVVVIVNFIGIWNEYYLASVILPTQDLFTLPAGMASFFKKKYETNWPVMSAGIVLSILPVFLMFMAAQEKIVEGFRVGHK
ncbi:MAG: carbohydrate ABC transporter permease [Chloroflexi bacterium]|jgi:raffinose/stachyose/melibiose transport system permease protein|nr:carbohydrate ABC transporter permease [Chloroflexota bacterium]